MEPIRTLTKAGGHSTLQLPSLIFFHHTNQALTSISKIVAAPSEPPIYRAKMWERKTEETP